MSRQSGIETQKRLAKERRKAFLCAIARLPQGFCTGDAEKALIEHKNSHLELYDLFSYQWTTDTSALLKELVDNGILRRQMARYEKEYTRWDGVKSTRRVKGWLYWWVGEPLDPPISPYKIENYTFKWEVKK